MASGAVEVEYRGDDGEVKSEAERDGGGLAGVQLGRSAHAGTRMGGESEMSTTPVFVSRSKENKLESVVNGKFRVGRK